MTNMLWICSEKLVESTLTINRRRFFLVEIFFYLHIEVGNVLRIGQHPTKEDSFRDKLNGS